ncbi:MAG: hypothetical protein HC818_00080 [Synechococcaceae cyanobacterium RM1_1_27]|nr:hypothetical protein [Synechococcaceae cyanobacterium RM1_1_27]
MIDHVIQMIAGSDVKFGLEEFLESLPFPAWSINKDGRKDYQNRACLLAWGNMIGDRLTDHDFDEASLNRMQIEDIYVRQHGSLVVENDVFYLRGKRYEYYKKLYYMDGKILGFCIPSTEFQISLRFSQNRLTDFQVVTQVPVHTTHGFQLESKSQ